MARAVCQGLALLSACQAAALGATGPSSGSLTVDVQAMQLVSPSFHTGASFVGPPHLTNIHGEKFTVARPGRFVLLQIPKDATAEDALLRVEGNATRVAAGCSEIVFQSMVVTGSWAEEKEAGGLKYSVLDASRKGADWEWFGKVELKMNYVSANDTSWLSMGMRHMRDVGSTYRLGGLLGDGSHAEAARPTPECNMLDLVQIK